MNVSACPMEDKDLILESAHRLKRWEETPRRVADDYADMNRDELIKLANYQRERLEEADLARRESDRKNAELSDKLTELTELLRKSNEAVSAMAVQVSELTRQLKAEREESAKLRSEVKAGRKHLFGKKSQKGTKSKDDDMPTPHTDVKGGFDGAPESLPDNLDVDVVKNTKDASGEPAARQKECRLYRLGKTYRTMDADNHVYHKERPGQAAKGGCRDKDVSTLHIQPGNRRDGERVRDSGIQGQGRQAHARLLPDGRREGRACN